MMVGKRRAEFGRAMTLKEVQRTEGCRNPDDNALARKCLGQIDLVTRRALHELHRGDRVADFDHDGGCIVEETSAWTRVEYG